MTTTNGFLPLIDGPMDGFEMGFSDENHIVMVTVRKPDGAFSTYSLVEEFDGTTRKLRWQYQRFLSGVDNQTNQE
jgi:hypothetical protein